jgi:hypothetical protein
MSTERTLDVGDCVIFHDEHGVPRPALVTAVHGSITAPDSVPCINLMFVSADPARTDGYGRQVERRTSLVHAAQQSAGGQYFRFADEAPNEAVKATV